MSFYLLSTEILWYHVLARNKEESPIYRAVFFAWKKTIDEIFTQKLKSFPLKLSPGRSAITYLKLKNYVPSFFESIWSKARKNPHYKDTDNVLRALELGLNGKKLKFHDLLNFKIILQNGAKKTRSSNIDDEILRGGLEKLTSLITKKSIEFEKKDPLSSKIMNTILLIKYGNLKMAVKRKNNEAQHHYLSLHQEPKILHQAFRACLKHSLTSTRRIFEIIIQETNFSDNASLEFNHLLGHAMAVNKWLRIFIGNVENQRNQLRSAEKASFIIDRSGFIRKFKFKTDFNFSPLHQAVNDQRSKIVADCLAKDHEIDLLDHSSRTPLLLAARGSSQKIFRILLEKGASLKKKDMWGLTAMDWCVLTGKPQWLRICKNFDKDSSDWEHALQLHKEPMGHALVKTSNMAKILKSIFSLIANEL